MAYNVSSSPRTDRVVVDASIHRQGDTMTFLYGEQGTVTVEQAPDGTCFVRLNLKGHQFVILE